MRGQILDKFGRSLGEVEVVASADLYKGHIERLATDAKVQRLFNKYQESVQGQLLVEVDRLEKEIEDLEPILIAESGERFPLLDLQIYPEEKLVSFQLK